MASYLSRACDGHNAPVVVDPRDLVAQAVGHVDAAGGVAYRQPSRVPKLADLAKVIQARVGERRHLS